LFPHRIARLIRAEIFRFSILGRLRLFIDETSVVLVTWRDEMQIHASVKPAFWGGVVGAIAMAIVGFQGLGWTTAGSAERQAQQQVNVAVAAALVPLCVAKAEQDPDGAKLAKFRAETSSWSGSQIVKDAGWATTVGMTSPDSALANACSEKLRAQKTG
jgi:hypothetical protein